MMESLGLAPTYVDYQVGLRAQERVHNEVQRGARDDTVLFCEHEPVYTAGRQARPDEYPWDGTPVVEIPRGGKVTWHGPGQLVAYPIVRLAIPLNAVKYVRALEGIIMDVLSDLGVHSTRVEGRTGVWLPADDRGPERKIAAIGIHISKWITMHGLALNCNNDLRPFGRIIPCGIEDAGVTSISQELGREITPADVIERLQLGFRSSAALHELLAQSRPEQPRPEKVA
ncbi:hypothetical protein GCM10009785_32940 [Brooklawnia cerclae]|nr:lipoyl(octanoyl) transferase LipB [Brooklawnia cerclae]